VDTSIGSILALMLEAAVVASSSEDSCHHPIHHVCGVDGNMKKMILTLLNHAQFLALCPRDCSVYKSIALLVNVAYVEPLVL
jgi:hypothetical protein